MTQLPGTSYGIVRVDMTTVFTRLLSVSALLLVGSQVPSLYLLTTFCTAPFKTICTCKRVGTQGTGDANKATPTI